MVGVVAEEALAGVEVDVTSDLIEELGHATGTDEGGTVVGGVAFEGNEIRCLVVVGVGEVATEVGDAPLEGGRFDVGSAEIGTEDEVEPDGADRAENGGDSVA
jgi:hypothetical protein